MTAPATKLLQPITVGPLELKNRIMFPPLTTGYEERDGSIGERSLAFYERLARGGVSYIVIGDVAPVMTASPTPKLATDAQIPTFKALADAVHKHGAKVALQLFHPEYDVPGVGRMVMGSMAAAKAAQEAKAAGDEETFAAKMAESNEIRKQAYAKLHHDMQHFVNEATVEQLTQIKEAIAASAARAQQAGIDAIEVHGDRLVGSLCSAILNQRTDEYGGSFENRVRYALEVVAAIKEAAPQLMVEYKLPVIMENPDGTPRGKGGLQLDAAGGRARQGPGLRAGGNRRPCCLGRGRREDSGRRRGRHHRVRPLAHVRPRHCAEGRHGRAHPRVPQLQQGLRRRDSKPQVHLVRAERRER